MKIDREFPRRRFMEPDKVSFERIRKMIFRMEALFL